MTRPHEAHFTALHVAQETRRAVQPYSVATKYEEAEQDTQRGDSTVIRARAASQARGVDVLREAAPAINGSQASDAATATQSNGSRAASPHEAVSERGLKRDSPERRATNPSKYHNIKTDGYASKREAKRAKTLYALQAAKVIANLRKQVPYVLIPRQLDHNGNVAERACTYIADFVYDDLMKNETVVEDCKGVRTAKYIIKRKLMRFTHGIVVRET